MRSREYRRGPFVKFVERWLARHRNPMSFWLHLLGMPCCFIVAPVFLFMRFWLLSALFFVAGYALQFLGHLVEGNRSGEEMVIRRILKREKGDRRAVSRNGEETR